MSRRVLGIVIVALLSSFAATEAFASCYDPRVYAEVGAFDAEGRFSVTILPTSQLSGSGVYLYFRGRRDLFYNFGLPYTIPLSSTCMIEPAELKIVPLKCSGDEHVPGAFVTTISNVTPQPGVSVQWQPGQDSPNGMLLIPYNFPNTTRGERKFQVFIDDVLFFETSTVSWERELTNSSGVWQLPVYTGCWAPGAHTVRVVATSCSGVHPTLIDEAFTEIDIEAKPSVSISASEDQDGNDTLNVTYDFPSTYNFSNRLLELSVDGVAHSSHQPATASGTWPIPLGQLCWQTAKVVATYCSRTTDPQSRADAQTGNTTDKPKITAFDLKKLGLDPQTGRRLIRAEIKYDLSAPNSRIDLDLLSWRSQDGQNVAGYHLGDRTSPTADTWVIDFLAPTGSQQLRIRATAQGCGITTQDRSIDCPPCDDAATAAPVYVTDGNMRLNDTDPLPPIAGHTLTRTYNSDEQVSGLFGRGFTTLFDRRLMIDTVANVRVVSVTSETNEVVTFETVTGGFRQTWPVTRSSDATLTEDTAAGTFSFRVAGSTEVAVFSSATGRLLLLRQLGTGREARIAYGAGGVPSTFTDSWTDVAWTFAYQGRRVTSISVSDRPDLSWTYTYDTTGNLTAVTVGTAVWRTYEYALNRLTESRDALNNLIESHIYDSNGHAIDSTGLGDEIANIQFEAPGSTPTESITVVTLKTGATTTYKLRPSGGSLRTVQVTGGCTSCGGAAGDRTYVRDAEGRIIRHQHADGHISVYQYANGRLVAEEHFLEPAGCDPETATNGCRLHTDALRTTGVVSTPATTRTEYVYGNSNWPDRPTSVRTRSVVATIAMRRRDIVYDNTSGAVISTTQYGFTDAAGQQTIQRGSTTTLYGVSGNEAAPAFSPGGNFLPAWELLPQPPFMTKSVDGPRTDVADVTAFVYYPVDPQVPALLRGRLAATRNAAGHITRLENYDAFGNVTRTVDPNGVATETTYDVVGRMKTTTIKGDPNCNGILDAECAADLTTQRTYASETGPLESEQRPRGGVTAYTYDDRGRILTVSRGPSVSDLRERVQTAYDALTGQKSIESIFAHENGGWVLKHREDYAYNSRAELVTVTHADGTAVHYSYDSGGRMATVQDENDQSASTKYVYDPAGRVKTVQQRLGSNWISTSHTYDRDGNLLSLTDPNGNVTSYVCDDFGQMIRQTSPVTGITQYEYDAAANVRTVTDANGMKTERTYDVLGRVTSASSAPASGTSSNARSEMVTWTYDDPAAGGYGIGRLASMTDPAGTTTYAYERRGLLRREQRTFGGCLVTSATLPDCADVFSSAAFVTTYRYDRDGNRSSITYPSNNLTVNYTFDYAGRPLTASGAVTSASYLPFGPLKQVTFANGTTQSHEYDSRYRLTENALTSGSTALAKYAYAYDAAGNVTAIHDVVDPQYNRGFAYDDLNRLTEANTGAALWAAGSYTWDAMGNPLTIKIGEMPPGGDDGKLRAGPPITTHSKWRPSGRTLTFAYSGTSTVKTPKIAGVATNTIPGGDDGLLRYQPRTHDYTQGRPVTYDAAGNELGYVVDRTYSARNLMQEVTRRADDPSDPFEHKLLYAYDGRGIRVVRGETPANGTTSVAHRYFFYTPELKLLSATASDIPNVWTPAPAGYNIIWFGSRPVAQISSTGITAYTFTDHLGTPILQTNATATITWQAEYEPFGHIYTMRTGERADQPLRLPGQEAAMAWEGQEENYNVFRWYRGGWGRYTQADPIGLAGGMNLYGYARSNPLTYTDPLGLATNPRDLDCCQLGNEINRLKDELQRRVGQEEAIQRQLVQGVLGRTYAQAIYRYWQHYGQYVGKQKRLKRLINEYDRRPCDPPLRQDVRQWSEREFPDDDYIWESYRDFLNDVLVNGPPRPRGPVVVGVPPMGPMPIPVIP
jgi:RHS repeat-associated protein